MRGIFVDWLVDVAEKYKLLLDTLYLSISFIDIFLSLNVFNRQKLQLLGVSSMLNALAGIQNAIECENYALAAELQDEISKLEAASLAASAKALAYENGQYTFRLGQKMEHKNFGIQPLCHFLDYFCLI
ncbi:clp protease adapter protein ClpF, chloroplastic-like [Carya illinoinensis]|uniref:clp protease adapter protein ClpF, chloroplastic-like n=1 Tax=Carya illinoinensis TaxID=32201 RepID=UPI001C723A76|nr:clp protease adapter protein ClpF, chloroplastic-like [Carya illinoinensis]